MLSTEFLRLRYYFYFAAENILYNCDAHINIWMITGKFAWWRGSSSFGVAGNLPEQIGPSLEAWLVPREPLILSRSTFISGHRSLILVVACFLTCAGRFSRWLRPSDFCAPCCCSELFVVGGSKTLLKKTTQIEYSIQRGKWLKNCLLTRKLKML